MKSLDGPWRLRARYAFPVIGAPIENALVTISGERIVDVSAIGTHTETAGATDLGDVAIVPGLVNAHTHLEFSHLAAPLGRRGQSFPDWIREVVAWRRGGAPLGEQRPVAVGLAESAEAGTTTLGEIATGLWSAAHFHDAPVDATVFYELIGLDRARIEPNLAAACEHLVRGREVAAPNAWRAGLSPHAPYTVHPQLFARLVTLSAAESVPLAFHLAESREELELLRSGAGAFVPLLSELGAWHAGAISRGTRPLDYLKLLTRAHRALVIHGNYLVDEEIDLLAQHSDRLALVYCARTHAYFDHERYPLEQCLVARVTMALGTDSRASNPDLSLWEEMRFIAQAYPAVAPAQVLDLGTQGGAAALGLESDRGTLAARKRADLAIVSLAAASTNDPYERLFAEESKPIATIRGGQITADRANLFSASRETESP